MNNNLYDMIFKRKSFHIFRGTDGKISESELNKIEEYFKKVKPLIPGIKTHIEIVTSEKTTCKRGQEYCILLYSEKKENYLQNIGYIGQQIDLFLASLDIGSLWFGIGKVQETVKEGMDYVIMLAVAKMPSDKFRKDMFKSKRKSLSEIWYGEDIAGIGNIVRFTPSACNSQPWKVYREDNTLRIYRYKKPGKRGIMPADKVAYYNRIDMGIFLCFLELCLKHEKIAFERKLFEDMSDDEREETAFAEYTII